MLVIVHEIKRYAHILYRTYKMISMTVHNIFSVILAETAIGEQNYQSGLLKIPGNLAHF